jgi:hypothetical protein
MIYLYIFRRDYTVKINNTTPRRVVLGAGRRAVRPLNASSPTSLVPIVNGLCFDTYLLIFFITY